MSKSVNTRLVFITVLLIASAGQAADWKDDLQKGLEQLYPLTKQALVEQNNITREGILLTVMASNIQAEPTHNFGRFSSRVKDGKVAAPGEIGSGFKDNATTLKPGDKVYITQIRVYEYYIRLLFLTEAVKDVTEKDTTKPTRLKGTLQFDLTKEQVQSLTPTDFKKICDPLLAPSGTAAATNTKTIDLGQTIQQVEAIFGSPERIAKLGPKTIYTYKDMKVTFMDGKVCDLQ